MSLTVLEEDILLNLRRYLMASFFICIITVVYLLLIYSVLVDENVVVGSSPAVSGKTSIIDYGKL